MLLFCLLSAGAVPVSELRCNQESRNGQDDKCHEFTWRAFDALHRLAAKHSSGHGRLDRAAL